MPADPGVLEYQLAAIGAANVRFGPRGVGVVSCPAGCQDGVDHVGGDGEKQEAHPEKEGNQVQDNEDRVSHGTRRLSVLFAGRFPVGGFDNAVGHGLAHGLDHQVLLVRVHQG